MTRAASWNSNRTSSWGDPGSVLTVQLFRFMSQFAFQSAAVTEAKRFWEKDFDLKTGLLGLRRANRLGSRRKKCLVNIKMLLLCEGPSN